MVLVLAKCGKISNVQTAKLAVTAILKTLFQLSRKAVTAIMKKLSQLSGKAVIAIMKKLSQLSGKAVCFGQKPMKSDGCFQIAGGDIQHLLDGFG